MLLHFQIKMYVLKPKAKFLMKEKKRKAEKRKREILHSSYPTTHSFVRKEMLQNIVNINSHSTKNGTFVFMKGNGY